jgi:HD domain
VNRYLRKIVHLERRFFRALSDRPPSSTEHAWALSFLSTSECELWQRMQNQDKRHSIEVARRLETFLPSVPPHALAAALMHDVGKIESRLGTFARVAATIVGSPTQRFRAYHDHERIGADMLRTAGSDPALIALVDETSDDHIVKRALRRADNI